MNTKPDPYIFNQLKDKSMYRKVISYWRLANEKKKVTVPSEDKNKAKSKDKNNSNSNSKDAKKAKKAKKAKSS